MGASMAQLVVGLICPLVTPLKSGDVVDERSLDRLIEHVGGGADALLVNDLFWGDRNRCRHFRDRVRGMHNPNGKGNYKGCND